MSQALSTLSLPHGPLLAGPTQIRMLMPSLSASPGLDLLKRRDLSSSLRVAYMLSKSRLLICDRPLYAVDKQCSFRAFAMQSEKRQAEKYRRQAKAQEDDDMGNDVMEDDDIENDWEHLQPEILTSFPEASDGKPTAQEKMNNKHINAKPNDASSVSEIIALCLRAKSKSKEASHDKVKRQTVQMSDAKGKGAGDKVLKILRQFGSQKSAASSRDVISKVQSLNGRPLSKVSHTQSVMTNGNSKPKEPSHTKVKGHTVQMTETEDKRAVDHLLKVLRKSLSQGSVEENGSPIAAPVVRQQEQVVSTSWQSEDTGFADESLNVGQENKKQLKSSVEHAALHVPDTSSITAVKKGENESYTNDAALQLDSSVIEQMDPSTLKLSDMRIIAKSRGLKGFSKLKKAELSELLKKGMN